MMQSKQILPGIVPGFVPYKVKFEHSEPEKCHPDNHSSSDLCIDLSNLSITKLILMMRTEVIKMKDYIENMSDSQISLLSPAQVAQLMSEHSEQNSLAQIIQLAQHQLQLTVSKQLETLDELDGLHKISMTSADINSMQDLSSVLNNQHSVMHSYQWKFPPPTSTDLKTIIVKLERIAAHIFLNIPKIALESPQKPNFRKRSIIFPLKLNVKRALVCKINRSQNRALNSTDDIVTSSCISTSNGCSSENSLINSASVVPSGVQLLSNDENQIFIEEDMQNGNVTEEDTEEMGEDALNIDSDEIEKNTEVNVINKTKKFSGNKCEQSKCNQMVTQNDPHPTCTQHSICLVNGKFDPSVCAICIEMFCKAQLDVRSRKLWRQRMDNIRKGMSRKKIKGAYSIWQSRELANRFRLSQIRTKCDTLTQTEVEASNRGDAPLSSKLMSKNLEHWMILINIIDDLFCKPQKSIIPYLYMTIKTCFVTDQFVNEIILHLLCTLAEQMTICRINGCLSTARESRAVLPHRFTVLGDTKDSQIKRFKNFTAKLMNIVVNNDIPMSHIEDYLSPQVSAINAALAALGTQDSLSPQQKCLLDNLSIESFSEVKASVQAMQLSKKALQQLQEQLLLQLQPRLNSTAKKQQKLREKLISHCKTSVQSPLAGQVSAAESNEAVITQSLPLGTSTYLGSTAPVPVASVLSQQQGPALAEAVASHQASAPAGLGQPSHQPLSTLVIINKHRIGPSSIVSNEKNFVDTPVLTFDSAATSAVGTLSGELRQNERDMKKQRQMPVQERRASWNGSKDQSTSSPVQVQGGKISRPKSAGSHSEQLQRDAERPLNLSGVIPQQKQISSSFYNDGSKHSSVGNSNLVSDCDVIESDGQDSPETLCNNPDEYNMSDYVETLPLIVEDNTKNIMGVDNNATSNCRCSTDVNIDGECQNNDGNGTSDAVSAEESALGEGWYKAPVAALFKMIDNEFVMRLCGNMYKCPEVSLQYHNNKMWFKVNLSCTKTEQLLRYVEKKIVNRTTEEELKTVRSDKFKRMTWILHKSFTPTARIATERFCTIDIDHFPGQMLHLLSKLGNDDKKNCTSGDHTTKFENIDINDPKHVKKLVDKHWIYDLCSKDTETKKFLEYLMQDDPRINCFSPQFSKDTTTHVQEKAAREKLLQISTILCGQELVTDILSKVNSHIDNTFIQQQMQQVDRLGKPGRTSSSSANSSIGSKKSSVDRNIKETLIQLEQFHRGVESQANALAAVLMAEAAQCKMKRREEVLKGDTSLVSRRLLDSPVFTPSVFDETVVSNIRRELRSKFKKTHPDTVTFDQSND